MRLRPVYLLFLAPLIVALSVVPGCDDGATTKTPKKRAPNGGGDEAEVARVEYEPKGRGTITGKVTYDGTPPPLGTQIMGPACCVATGDHDSENRDQDWVVDAKGGVKNVIIMLQPPAGKYYKLPPEQQKPKDMLVELTQPRCQFVPHVFVLFPSIWDGATKAPKETGQQFAITNEASCNHNSNVSPGGEINRPSNLMLKTGDKVPQTMRPQDTPITVSCNIHSWMRAYFFVVDHPYYAITATDGTFKIENAPLGVPVRVVAWHEATSPSFFNGGPDGKLETLQDNQVLEFKIKKGR